MYLFACLNKYNILFLFFFVFFYVWIIINLKAIKIKVPNPEGHLRCPKAQTRILI